MQDNVKMICTSMPQGAPRRELEIMLSAIADRMSSQATSGAGLEIAGTTTLAQIGSATTFHGVAGGVPVTIAAGTDMPALVGSITANSFNVFCFFIDSASTVTVAMGTEGTTRARVVFPPFPPKKALVGYLVITHSSTFVGGTTVLSTATTQYVSPVGAFDPTILIG